MAENGKGYPLGSYCDRKFILEYLIRQLDKKLEENPDGGLKRKGKVISYADMKKEAEVWLKVWYK